MSSLLEISRVCKGYGSGEGRLEVLADLDLEVATGEMIAITGVSGSGKSTLLHLAGGMDRPDAGSVSLSGMRLDQLPAAELAAFRNRRIGFVFQFHHLLPEFSALENVMMPLLLRGLPLAAASAPARAALEDVGLGSRSRHRPGELSGGEQQRVALARALVGGPQLLLADEPTGNLDASTGQAVGELLKEMHRRHGLTSMIVTHNDRLAAICTRVCRLQGGRLIAA